MLLELTISDFAIIDRLALTLSDGLNVLTGETGAGKSIVIDAVSALLGGRVGAEYVRDGASQARLEGVFFVGRGETEESSQIPCLKQILEEYGLDDGEDTLILCREINASGRTVSRVNGRAVPLATLQQVGRLLIDIHGQSEHLSLLRVSHHLDLLDEYAGLRELRSRLGERVSRLRQVRRELQTLLQDERALARRMDLLRFQVAEINSAALEVGEEERLEQERRILSNAETLAASANRVYKLLYDGLGEQRSVSDLLGEAGKELAEIARLDPSLLDGLTALEAVGAQVEDLARRLRLYRDGIEYDPARLQTVEERLELVRDLKRKYGSSIAEVLAFGKQAAAELESLSHSEERITDLQDVERALLREVAEMAEELSAARAAAGERLAAALQVELADLNMPKARFVVQLQRNLADDGVLLSDGQTYEFDAAGIDHVEFLISPNPGEPPKPLAKIASGGETARTMLALKTILSAADPVPTLIFDEIDQGIGGRSGQVVGKKLWSLSRRHQVICVTHLPQIACFADRHFNVTKRFAGDRTVTTASLLQEDQRVNEIVAMLGGIATSDASRQSAVEMLAEAERWKAQILRGKEVASYADKGGTIACDVQDTSKD